MAWEPREDLPRGSRVSAAVFAFRPPRGAKRLHSRKPRGRNHCGGPWNGRQDLRRPTDPGVQDRFSAAGSGGDFRAAAAMTGSTVLARRGPAPGTGPGEGGVASGAGVFDAARLFLMASSSRGCSSIICFSLTTPVSQAVFMGYTSGFATT